jgi:hypothetical protein
MPLRITVGSQGRENGRQAPYVSGTGVLTQILDHLKKSFPATLNAEVLRKLGFAPKNESYVINVLRFLNLIDEKGARTESARKLFTLHDTTEFSKAFGDAVKSAYSDLFALHGEGAWKLSQGKLITFFRQTDHSSELVGTRQANTFRTLAAYAGHADTTAAPRSKPAPRPERAASAKKKPAKASEPASSPPSQALPPSSPPGSEEKDRNFGLTVRIEINLPVAPDQETYDRIFKSIRENLLNG